MFEINFDDEEELTLPTEEAEQTPAVAEEAEKITPTYSEEEVESARQQGFEAGRKEGLEANAEVITKQISETLININETINSLFKAQENYNQELSHDANSLAISIFKKMMPALAKRHSFEEVDLVLNEAFEKFIEEPKITLIVHPDIANAIEERFGEIAKNRGYEGKIVIQTNENIGPSDCRIDWINGGTERNTTELWAEINSIIDQNLGENLKDNKKKNKNTPELNSDDSDIEPEKTDPTPNQTSEDTPSFMPKNKNENIESEIITTDSEEEASNSSKKEISSEPPSSVPENIDTNDSIKHDLIEPKD